MDTLLGLRELDRARARVVTIGVFDGLHRGHQAVLDRLVRESHAVGVAATAVTFDPHPDAVLRGAPPPRLSDPEQLVEGMAALGIDEFVVQPFDEAFSRLDPEPFLRLLGAGEGLRAFLMTPDAAFGYRRRGDAATVARIGERLGFRLVLVTPLLLGGRSVSSSRVREAIAAGRLADARDLLGRSPSVTGRVVKGAGRGRDLGFPTANLAFDEPVALPPDGIYAVRVTWRRSSGEPWHSGTGVASLGVRPTFGPGERILEVYLFGVKEPLYGATMRVSFERRQRGERRFATAAGLIRQMTRDAARARQILRVNPGQ
jgi:riboflavin kinase / FMN adenylyltransferase